MDINNFTREEAIRVIKTCLVRLKKDIKTKTKTYYKDYYYYYMDDSDGIFIYDGGYTGVGLRLTYEEADEFLDWDV